MMMMARYSKGRTLHLSMLKDLCKTVFLDTDTRNEGDRRVHVCIIAFLSSVDDDEEYSLQSVDVVFVVVGGFLCEVCSVLSHPTHIVAPPLPPPLSPVVGRSPNGHMRMDLKIHTVHSLRLSIWVNVVLWPGLLLACQ